jgi:hypothetical protein
MENEFAMNSTLLVTLSGTILVGIATTLICPSKQMFSVNEDSVLTARGSLPGFEANSNPEAVQKCCPLQKTIRKKPLRTINLTLEQTYSKVSTQEKIQHMA